MTDAERIAELQRQIQAEQARAKAHHAADRQFAEQKLADQLSQEQGGAQTVPNSTDAPAPRAL
ncbi:hypothetical protein [Kitasatospora sp. NPDC001547]|uniref:hypothetical protein n=1 Tax=Kitasatospora sp. NPDC001547 TaxID=3364015 RepID=UPI0036C0EAB3